LSTVSALGGLTVTVTNFDDYTVPTIFVQIVDSSDNVLIAHSDFTIDGDTLTCGWGTVTGTNTLEVKVQDFGEDPSAAGTASVTPAGANFRYFRIDSFTSASTSVQFAEFKFYTALDGGGTMYPPTMTSDTAPSPYVIDDSYHYGAYAAWKISDGSIYSQWWNLATSTFSTDWVSWDLGATRDIKSMKFTQSASYQISSFKIWGSSTGSFSGEEALVAEVSPNMTGYSVTTI
jgi:hypothetical protein